MLARFRERASRKRPCIDNILCPFVLFLTLYCLPFVDIIRIKICTSHLCLPCLFLAVIRIFRNSTLPLPPTPVSVPLARERINVCTFVPLSCHLFLCLVIGGVHLLRLSWLGRGLSICMRVCMVCVSTHVFLPLTPCIRLELALTVHWAHLVHLVLYL